MITACYLAIFLQFVSMEVVCHEAAVLDCWPNVGSSAAFDVH